MPLPTLVLAAAALGPAAAPAVTTSGTPSPSPTPSLTGTPPDHAGLILWLVVGGIIVAGCVVIAGRVLLKQGTSVSIIRSWIAISLVIGLLVFCAATLLGDNSSLQSILFGGLIASTGAVIAFYYSSQQANQARADILSAAVSIGQGGTKPSTFSSPAPPDGKVNDAYSHRFVADGVPAPTYGVTSGALPPGLILNPDGTLNGQPTTAGPFTFKVTAANSAGFIASPDLTVTISPE
jgi:Putative Ig domain